MPNWAPLLKNGILEKCGKSCSTWNQLAKAIAVEINEPVSRDSLCSAYNRYKDPLNLKASLMDYMGVEQAEKKPPKLKPEDITFEFSRKRAREVKKAKRFIITSAMNNCKLHEDTWKSIEQWAAHNKAAIIVIPVRYKNPTTPGECVSQDESAWWPDELLPYMTDDRIELHEHLCVMAHVRIQATAVNPLSGLEALSKAKSAVFGHAQLTMKMVAAPHRKLPKVMYTTGSVSIPDYSDTRAGVKGQFHHGMGAVVVENDGPRFHVRAVVMDIDGGFQDLDRYYSAKGSKKAPPAEGLVFGDTHAQFNDSKCRAGTFENSDSMVKILKPKKLVWHDLFDGYSISHHNRKDPLIQYSKHQHGHHLVEDELQLTLDLLEKCSQKGAENLVVSSNHHDHLLKWMKEVHAPTNEPWNTKIWLKLWDEITDLIEYRECGIAHADPFAMWMSKRLKAPTRFLSTDSDECIAGIAVGMHGHNGINGSRGTLNQFSKIGVKSISGHGHTPGILQGAYRTGTSSTLKLDYTKGPSSWAHCHCAIFANGKRQLIFVIDGKWRAPK